MKRFYLVFAILGAIIPYAFFFGFIQTNGFDIPKFASALFGNGAVGGFSADILISSFVFWLFMLGERKNGGPNPLLFIVLNLTIGLSCALPAYLYARSELAPTGI